MFFLGEVAQHMNDNTWQVCRVQGIHPVQWPGLERALLIEWKWYLHRTTWPCFPLDLEVSFPWIAICEPPPFRFLRLICVLIESFGFRLQVLETLPRFPVHFDDTLTFSSECVADNSALLSVSHKRK